MANMKLIEAKTLSSAVAQIDFNSIPQTYTDLKLVMCARGSASNVRTNFLINFNGISTGFTWLGFYGYGSTTGSNSGTGSSYRIYGNASANSNAANLFSNAETYISNYSSTSKLKQAYSYSVIQNTSTDNFIEVDATVWTNTNAITSLSILNSDSSTFMVGSTFYLYGIANTLAGGAKAIGGYVTEDANYFYHTFLSSGVFTPTQSLSCDILVVAGGGGGGTMGGGGGAGGVLSYAGQSLTTTSYAVTVGAGGTGAAASSSGALATQGSNSTFASLTSSVGGGAGGSWNDRGGSAGGSGGGQSGNSTNTGYAGTSGQGNAGGNSNSTYAFTGSGGGGAGAAGANVTTVNSTDGGIGVNTYQTWYPITLLGTSNYIAAGGGGGNWFNQGAAGKGGLGGGGNGSNDGTVPGYSAVNNTGSGGGAGGFDNYGFNKFSLSGSGGSGIIIVRYAK